ncbi:MAG: hypothetical protein ACP5N2_00895 [Candidatus Nanoarchaeia archaeon]
MNKIIKRALQMLVAATIVSGTYFGRGKDFPPIYSHKTGDSYGINVAAFTKVDSGASINGGNISIITKNYGEITGLNAGIVTDNYGEINGFNVGIVTQNYSKIKGTNINGLCRHYGGSMNGLELALFNGDDNFNPDKSSDLNGVAIALFNFHRELNGVQIGIYNGTKDNAGVILNVDYQKYNGETK